MNYNLKADFMSRLKMARLPAYPDLLKLRTERSDAILLDLGCCCESTCPLCTLGSSPDNVREPVGNDIRKAVLDGFPVQNVIASDLQPRSYLPVSTSLNCPS